MSWSQLATITPNFNWQGIGKPIDSNVILRFSWLYAPAGEFPGSAALVVAQTYPFDGWFNFRKIHASDKPSLLIYPIPDEFKAIGENYYFPEFKLTSRSRWNIDGTLQVKIDEWDGPVSPFVSGEYGDV